MSEICKKDLKCPHIREIGMLAWETTDAATPDTTAHVWADASRRMEVQATGCPGPIATETTQERKKSFSKIRKVLGVQSIEAYSVTSYTCAKTHVSFESHPPSAAE